MKLSENPEDQRENARPNANNIQNNINRLCFVDPKNITHYIVGYKCYPTHTEFTIRTSLNNLTIVNDILMGRLPAFSIRTHAIFAPDSAFGGCFKANNLQFVTIDYVRNQADVKAISELEMKKVDVATGETLRLKVDSRIGTESDAKINALYNNNDIIVMPDSTNLVNTLNHGIKISVKATTEEMLKEVYSGIF